MSLLSSPNTFRGAESLYRVESHERPDGVFELSDGRFQLISGGATAVVMTGVDYVLVRRDLADFLTSLHVSGFRREPAVIYRRAAGIEIHSHDRLLVEAHQDLKSVPTIAPDGLTLLVASDEHLFVTPDLREKLIASKFRDELSFYYGLAAFA